MKETTYTIDGQSIAFPAPYIIKDFYFPEDAQTEEGWNAVQSHVDECSRSAEYFKAENLKPCNCRAARMLRMLQDSRYELYTVPGRSLLLLRPSCSSFSSGNAVRLHTKKGAPGTQPRAPDVYEDKAVVTPEVSKSLYATMHPAHAERSELHCRWLRTWTASFLWTMRRAYGDSISAILRFARFSLQLLYRVLSALFEFP